VQAAQLAQTKAQDSAAKSYAKQMIQDHEKNNQQLMQIAQSKGVTPPTKLDSKHQSMLTKLQKADGADFDQQYGKIMDQSHRETVQLFERGQKQVKDSELKSYISQTLPTLHQHHEQAASLPGAKGSTRQAEAGSSGSSSGSQSGRSGGSSSGMGGSSSGSMGGSSGGSTSGSGSSSGSMSGSGSGSTSGSMGGTSGSSSSSPGSSSSSGTATRPPGTSSSSSDTGSTGRP
jgi:putative membrane protein